MPKSLCLVSTLCIFALCPTSMSFAQSPTYGKPIRSESVEKNLQSIELKLEEVLELLPKTISGSELERARSQINAAFRTVVQDDQESGADKSLSNPTDNAPVVRENQMPQDPNLILLPRKDLSAVAPDSAEPQDQPSKQPQVGRYQISSWTLPPTDVRKEGQYGAFIIDTQSGMIWKLEANGTVRRMAKVPK